MDNSLKSADYKLRWLASSIPASKIIFGLERTISETLSGVLFSADLRLGRGIALIMLLFAPAKLIWGVAGIFLCQACSFFLSRNRVLNSTKIFEMNGWFLGLALASFEIALPTKVIALCGLAPVCALAVVVIDRALKAWDLPVIVLPYCVTFWFLQLLGHNNPAIAPQLMASSLPHSSGPLMDIATGSLRGFSQIFYSNDLGFALALTGLLAILRRQQVGILLLSAIAPTILSYIVSGSSHFVVGGLTSFSGILMTEAYLSGSLKANKYQYLLIILASGLVELISLRMAQRLGLFALSVSYIICMWTAKLGVESQKSVGFEKDVIMTW